MGSQPLVLRCYGSLIVEFYNSFRAHTSLQVMRISSDILNSYEFAIDDSTRKLERYASNGSAESRYKAAIGPDSAGQVQEIVQIANEFRIPLHPFSTGRYLGYGGAAPALSGSVVLDLRLIAAQVDSIGQVQRVPRYSQDGRGLFSDQF